MEAKHFHHVIISPARSDSGIHIDKKAAAYPTEFTGIKINGFYTYSRFIDIYKVYFVPQNDTKLKIPQCVSLMKQKSNLWHIHVIEDCQCKKSRNLFCFIIVHLKHLFPYDLLYSVLTMTKKYKNSNSFTMKLVYS